MKERISICIVTSVHPDFDARIWRHATGLAALGARVTLICPWEVVKDEVREGVCLVPFRRVRSRLARPFLVPYRVLSTLLGISRQVDLIHFHDIDILPYMAAISLRKLVVYDVHENYPDEVLVRGYRFLPQWIRPFLALVVRIGQWVFSSVIGNVVLVVPEQESDFWGKRIQKVFIWNFASRSLAEGRTFDYVRRGPIVIFPGSQYLENGSLLLLEIAARVKIAIPEVQFHVSDKFHGVRDFRELFLDKRRKLGLEETVILLPPVPASQMMSILNLGRVGIIPALPVPKIQKAMPVKLFEYMASGLPIVSFDLPHPTRVIQDSKCGTVVRCGDTAKFADAIIELLSDTELASAVGERGAAAFRERYNWEAQMPLLMSFYERALHHRAERNLA